MSLLNVHPSLIPKYRGPAPIQWAIANGDTRTGVSIINMEDVSQGFDTGDIHAVRELDMPEAPTYPSLAPVLANIGGNLLVDVLRRLIAGKVERTPQDAKQVTRARLITEKVFEVNWTHDANRIERLHRAVGHQRPLFTTFKLAKSLKRLQLYDVG
ncbi:Methionyl-tRNA formyltransferase, partial [Tulasnella sp. 403]